MAKNPVIVFFGSPVFGKVVLNKMIGEGFKVAAVVTQPDRSQGRGKKRLPTPVKSLAKEKKITVYTPENKSQLKKLKTRLKKLKPDLFVVASYGLIIPEGTLEIPAKGSLNVHPSLLPSYRGATPIQAAILNGDTETGVTIMLMDERMDHGPLVAQKKVALEPDETLATATVKLAHLGGELLVKTIPNYLKGEIIPQPQNHEKATYTKLLKKEDGKISWGSSNEKIERMLRAYQPWPGVWTTVGELAEQLDRDLKNQRHKNLKLKILAAHLENGAIVMDTMQVEGKKPISFQDFIKGYLA